LTKWSKEWMMNSSVHTVTAWRKDQKNGWWILLYFASEQWQLDEMIKRMDDEFFCTHSDSLTKWSKECMMNSSVLCKWTVTAWRNDQKNGWWILLYTQWQLDEMIKRMDDEFFCTLQVNSDSLTKWSKEWMMNSSVLSKWTLTANSCINLMLAMLTNSVNLLMMMSRFLGADWCKSYQLGRW